jgi:phosphoenolpyruvate synthase/pyruvate phosphate dikinase
MLGIVTPRYITWLDDIDATARAAVGGKAASLATMHAAGFPVPPGFAVTIEGYRRFIEGNQIGEFDLETDSLRDAKVAEEVSLDICGRISQCDLPDDLKTEVLLAFDKLRDRVQCRSFAVRSSAISEDSSSASFAGLYESYLNVRDAESLLHYVRACFASLWSGRALHYRTLKGLDHGREAMGVVVMELVDSVASGVAFTVNPVTGDNGQVVINSTWGLGEAVVAGIVTPDMYVVDKESLGLLSRDIYHKEVAMVPDPAGAPRTVEVRVDSARAGAPSLSDEQAIAVATLARDVEQHYGKPQDVEWAVSGSLYLLQARPVTTV